jgi:hypothetical protein
LALSESWFARPCENGMCVCVCERKCVCMCEREIQRERE